MTRRCETHIRCDAESCEQSAKAVASYPNGTIVQLSQLGWRIGRKRDLCPAHASKGGVTR